jgi:manganese transport protein
MEGFLNIRLPAWLRRLITRLLAIIPAMAVAILYGESGTAKLLILSQVILSLQLPFAVIPLVHFTSSIKR